MIMVQKNAGTGQKVGFVGLGAMGGRMVAHLKGFADVQVFDLDVARREQAAAAAGGKAVASIGAMADAQVVILMLPDSPIVDKVLRNELLKTLKQGAMVIDMSSSTPANTIENAKLSKQHGITFIDAPVSGGIGGAESGKLAIMAGGDAADFARALPLLNRMGTKVVHVGPVGSGHAVKALNNLLGATILVATSEIFAAGEKFGLDPAVMHQVIDASSGGSFMSAHAWPRAVLPKTWNFGFAMQLMNKDVGIAMSLIESTGVKTVLCEANAALWAKAVKENPGADMTIITKNIREAAGL
jgi:3-hydroxyisobutyrate dehydrogenase